MWSVLYVLGNELFQIGPFGSPEEADAAARKAQEDDEFDVMDTEVYLMTPTHGLDPYSIDDLCPE